MASALDDQPAWFGVEFNFFRKIRFIEQRLGDTDSPRIADPNDARLRGHCDYSVATLVGSGKCAPSICKLSAICGTHHDEHQYLNAYRLREAEDREVYDAVENVYALQRAQRRLFTVANLLPRGLAARLQRWVEGGRYADLFDHVDDTHVLHRGGLGVRSPFDRL